MYESLFQHLCPNLVPSLFLLNSQELKDSVCPRCTKMSLAQGRSLCWVGLRFWLMSVKGWAATSIEGNACDSTFYLRRSIQKIQNQQENTIKQLEQVGEACPGVMSWSMLSPRQRDAIKMQHGYLTQLLLFLCGSLLPQRTSKPLGLTFKFFMF